METLASGLRYIDHEIGSGNTAKSGDTVSVHYSGYLALEGDERGAKFDSSVDRNQFFSFPLGVGMVIRGWDEGISGMKVGGKRTLFIPANLGYGAHGAGDVIPPNSDLIFDVELLATRS